jgi:predicted O-linked N-acetylglucosamine transferase (SPINDLY family)
MDYFLAALEPDGASHYTERLHRLSRLPVYFYPPAAPAGTLTRAALGIEAGVRLYVCAQSLFKLHPDYDAILGEILRRDPGGQLVLIEGQSARWSRDWRERFTRACPDVSERVRFVPRLPAAEFLDLLCMADALLDSFPFGGGTTSYAALGLGAPIVTWPGPFMRGRVTFGCYQQLGVTDCVAASPEEYVELAVRLANDPAWRAELGARLTAARARLFEDLGVVREIEDFFVRARAEAPGRIWPDQAGDPNRIATGTCIAGTGSRPAGWPCVRATRRYSGAL